jgi:cytoskeleton-associated protein 5
MLYTNRDFQGNFSPHFFISWCDKLEQLGDPREPTRVRVQSIIQGLPKVYAYSRVFQLLLEHGLKSKVAKTRQNTLDEMSGILKRSGLGACEPTKAFPVLGQMIADKDGFVRKAALNTLR